MNRSDKRREYLLYLITFIVLGSALTNFFQNSRHATADPEFYEDVKRFIMTGPRNTAKDGYNLCVRLSHLEAEHHNSTVTVDCRAIYFGKEETPDD